MTGGKREKKKANIEKKKNSASSGIQNFQNSNAENNEKNPAEEHNSTVKNLHKSVNDLSRKQGDTDKINEKVLEDVREIRENQENMEKKQSEKDSQISEKLQFICEKLEKIEKKSEESSLGSLMKNTSSSETKPFGRSFVLKHVFEDVSKFEEGEWNYSEEEEYFGVSWSMLVYKSEQHLDFIFLCHKSLYTGSWAIDTKFTLKLIGLNGETTSKNCKHVFRNEDENKKFSGRGRAKLISLEEMGENYLVDDKLSAEIHVVITKMTGIYKKNLRHFDESMEEVSNMVLVAGDQKFYTSKYYLATHSPYFKSLFLGQFQESNQSEIELTGIAAEDFQNFLEVLYGDPAIDEITVEGILLVADLCNTSMAIEKCEDFLLEKSKKSNKKKLQLAIRYRLEKLKAKCMSEIKSIDDIKSIISGNLEDLEPSMTTALLKKSISFQ